MKAVRCFQGKVISKYFRGHIRIGVNTEKTLCRLISHINSTSSNNEVKLIGHNNKDKIVLISVAPLVRKDNAMYENKTLCFKSGNKNLILLDHNISVQSIIDNRYGKSVHQLNAPHIKTNKKNKKTKEL